MRMHIQISITPNTKDLPGVRSSSPSASILELLSELRREKKVTTSISTFLLLTQYHGGVCGSFKNYPLALDLLTMYHMTFCVF